MPKGKGYGRKRSKKPMKRTRPKNAAPSSMLGSGLMGGAAKKMRRRRRMLEDI